MVTAAQVWSRGIVFITRWLVNTEVLGPMYLAPLEDLVEVGQVGYLEQGLVHEGGLGREQELLEGGE